MLFHKLVVILILTTVKEIAFFTVFPVNLLFGLGKNDFLKTTDSAFFNHNALITAKKKVLGKDGKQTVIVRYLFTSFDGNFYQFSGRWSK